jgi:hypothetical protein
MYNANKNNKQKYYLQSDVIKTIETKFPTTQDYIAMVETKRNRVCALKLKKQNLVDTRKKEIIKIFKDHKLNFNNVGDCYMYINYGKPSLTTIMTNEIAKLNEQNERRKCIAKELETHSIVLDHNVENIDCVKSYILATCNLHNYDLSSIIKHVVQLHKLKSNSINNYSG